MEHSKFSIDVVRQEGDRGRNALDRASVSESWHLVRVTGKCRQHVGRRQSSERTADRQAGGRGGLLCMKALGWLQEAGGGI